ncbi:hypothetical protein IU470_18770 [Nocardia abscessus]|uniref:Uncharacterized protein n=1 Tax=Nocardia abscessus TaxID=120957 RepID=A0ABS0C9V0_9NOCA|nr:hypothetical protein [Nocardia abscessus]MBF6227140.1 hypothetical protein [Nocardia abscessus]
MFEIDRLSDGQLHEVFGADRRWLQAPGFPEGERDGDGVARWPADRVWEWLAAQQPQAAAVVPLRYWPRGVAVYQSAREIPDGVVQDWSVQGVVLRVVWPTVEAFASGGVAAAAANLAPSVSRVIKVHHDFGFRGPTLSVHDESGRAIKDDEPVWPELALVLGGRAPYWPYGLRDAAAMRRWRPGDPPVPVAAAVDALDPAPLLRLAALIPAGDTAHAVLVALARYAEHRPNQDAAHTVEMITEDPNMAAWVDLAAISMPVPEPDDLEEVVLRDGWLSVAARTDTLAHHAVSEVRKSRYSVYLPYTAAEYIDPTTDLGAEWADRLRPTSPYAGFGVLYDHLGADEEHTITGYLTDPATDAPVVRLASGNLLAAVPHRLPVSSPLASVTVGSPIWVRLADATVHLAPRRDTPGISWGYCGSGTSTLALLIARLLDDITAPAADQLYGGGAGLENLLQAAWPEGTTFTRTDLDAARAQQ